MSLLCLYAQRAKSSLKNRIIPRGKTRIRHDDLQREENASLDRILSATKAVLGWYKGGDQQISTATRILAEVIASDAAWLMVFNGRYQPALFPDSSGF